MADPKLFIANLSEFRRCAKHLLSAVQKGSLRETRHSTCSCHRRKPLRVDFRSPPGAGQRLVASNSLSEFGLKPHDER